MDFFQQQDLARRNTRVMVILYLIAVAGVVLAVDLVLAVAYLNIAELRFRPGTGPVAMLHAVPRGLYLWGALGTVGVIFSASLVQMLQLVQGGRAVAEMVGARAISRDTSDPLEKRLLNIVEEMAIASGVRVPQAYVMDGESGINAFAAGYDVSNAIVAVTRGTLETLSRDELQGVIGHEFSHILNGDMWLNIKMIGVLSGIVFIGGIGSFLMRTVRSSDDNKSAGGIFLLGLALFLVGYVGTFFARLIKAAVSRQREFLADASSVQFTRNPDGIAGALDQIRASGRGALIANRYAEDMSHMYFGQGISVWMGGLFDTHPPIDERISRVRPGFQASRYRQARAAAEPEASAVEGVGAASGFAGAPAPDGQRASDKGAAWGRSAGESAKLVGTLDAGKVDFAARLIARLPFELRSAMNETQGACAVMVASLLAPKQEVLEAQLAAVRALGQDPLAERARSLMPLIARLGRGFDLMLVDLSLPSIKAGTDADRRDLLAALEAVIHADRRVSLHEFVVLTLVKTQLAPRAKPGAVKTKPLAALRAEVVLALSLIAYAGRKPGADPALDREVEAAFAAGAAVAGVADARLTPKSEFSLDAAGTALANLMTVAPLAKAILVKALFAVVSADGTIRLMEAELMRLIGAVLDCPLPPLIEDIDPATLEG
ncbi:MAG: M48 family metallopeptidase [Proteobacteria bacterium]|nr:M48 family metallopeptidase [Pseudomonadota bacterium]